MVHPLIAPSPIWSSHPSQPSQRPHRARLRRRCVWALNIVGADTVYSEIRHHRGTKLDVDGPLKIVVPVHH